MTEMLREASKEPAKRQEAKCLRQRKRVKKQLAEIQRFLGL